ncbi:hypothetical protein M3T53_07950 [Actinomyces sp. B33]|uniref:hypothetical protein n=1 Tax=Actinomyces sp. B33 TaxID=2942131 RepID=UPI002342130E|nr:hypothetical protein [Actinomyces sp. B33]MDC4233635.1 hypothetical protein [Actinomyces sp. B33]
MSTQTAPDSSQASTRYRAGTWIGIGAMVIFGVLSLVLICGVIVGPADLKPYADSLFPWSLGALAVSGVGMLLASARRPRDPASEDD